MVGRAADALDHDVGPVLLAPRHRLGLVQHGDAEALGRGPLVRVPRRDRHLGRPVAGDERGAQADRAGAEHEDLAVRADVRQPDAPHGDRERLGERRDDGIDRVRDGRKVGERRVDELRQSAVAAQPEPGAAAPAQVGAAGRAELAPPAHDVRRDRVAHVGQAGRAVDHRAHHLVAGRRAQRRPDRPVPEVKVGAADAARFDP